MISTKIATTNSTIHLLSEQNLHPTVLYLVPQWWGAVKSAVRFSKVLQKQGWTINFVLVKNFPFKSCEIFDRQLEEQKSYIINQGFFCNLVTYRTDSDPPKMINPLVYGRFFNLAVKNFTDDISLLIERYSPNLITLHFGTFLGSLAAAKLQVPYVMINDSFCGPINGQRPPANSSIILSFQLLLNKLQIAKAWLQTQLRGLFMEILCPSLLLIKMSIKRFMAKVRIHPVACEFFVGIIPDCPIFYLMPESLDFTPVKGHHYLGDDINLSEIGAFNIEQFSDDEKPLIYGSLGSMSHNWPSAKRFFKVFLEMAQQQKNSNFVLHIGGDITPEELGEIPSNVYVAQWVDQLAVLRKSSVMVTHGGTNTLRECIALSVPMIVLPAHWDHFGSGARVVYHGLGLRGNLKNIKSDQLSEMIDEVLNNPSYLDNVKKMQPEFLHCSTQQGEISYLERLAYAVK